MGACVFLLFGGIAAPPPPPPAHHARGNFKTLAPHLHLQRENAGGVHGAKVACNCRAGRDLQEASPVLFGEIARAREMKVTARPAREPQSAKSASCQH